jgi:hypothetical protein
VRRNFDHFATYVPKPGNTVNNLLSEGIIRADGSPVANYSQAVQRQGTTSVVPTHHSISYVILSGALAREIPIRFFAGRASAQSKDLRFRGTLRKGHRGGRRIEGTQSAQDLSSLVRRGERGICLLASSHRPLAVMCDHAPNLTAARALAFAASCSRFLGAALVSSDVSKLREIAAISSTAARKAASFAFDGLLKPVILRTYCSAAARVSSSVTGGSKLKSVLMFLHIDLHPIRQNHATRSTHYQRFPNSGILVTDVMSACIFLLSVFDDVRNHRSGAFGEASTEAEALRVGSLTECS